MATLPAASAWEVHPAKNCWWNGHGADEVDTPNGVSVPGIHTVKACKAACLEFFKYEAVNTGWAPIRCTGFAFQASTQSCFRKTNIKVAECSVDPSYVLYIRADPSHPPKPAGTLIRMGTDLGSTDHSHAQQAAAGTLIRMGTDLSSADLARASRSRANPSRASKPAGKQLSVQERVEALNRRFRNGRPSDDLASSGVLVRQFDTLDDASKKWLPCPPEGNNNWCKHFSDRWPTSIINANQLALYYGPGKGGLIIAPTVELFCAYPADGNSMAKVCDPLFGDGDTCIPGCYPKGQECQGDVTWTCSYPPERLRDALQAQANRVDYQSSNNELVVDVRTVVSRLPDAIEGFFFIGDRTEAEQTRHTFLAEYGMTEETGPPLVELVLSHDGGFILAQ